MNVNVQPTADPHRKVPPREPARELLEMKRRAEEMGIEIRLPAAPPDWVLPEPLPMPADLVSDIVVQQRRGRGF